MGSPFKLRNGSLLLVTEAPGGIYNSSQLKKIATLCEEDSAIVKATEDQRIALFVEEEKAEKVANELKSYGLGIRNYQEGLHQPVSCIGELCPEYKQDAQGAAMMITEVLSLFSVDHPLRIGINGCERCCVPCHTLDLSIVGDDLGFRVSIGGKNSQIPEMATYLAEGVPMNELPGFVGKIVELYKEDGQEGESLQDLIERQGLSKFVEALKPYSQDADGDFGMPDFGGEQASEPETQLGEAAQSAADDLSDVDIDALASDEENVAEDLPEAQALDNDVAPASEEESAFEEGLDLDDANVTDLEISDDQELSFEGELSAEDDLSVEGDLAADPDLELEGELSAEDDLSVEGDLAADPDLELDSGLNEELSDVALADAEISDAEELPSEPEELELEGDLSMDDVDHVGDLSPTDDLDIDDQLDDVEINPELNHELSGDVPIKHDLDASAALEEQQVVEQMVEEEFVDPVEEIERAKSASASQDTSAEDLEQELVVAEDDVLNDLDDVDLDGLGPDQDLDLNAEGLELGDDEELSSDIDGEIEDDLSIEGGEDPLSDDLNKEEVDALESQATTEDLDDLDDLSSEVVSEEQQTSKEVSQAEALEEPMQEELVEALADEDELDDLDDLEEAEAVEDISDLDMDAAISSEEDIEEESMAPEALEKFNEESSESEALAIGDDHIDDEIEEDFELDVSQAESPVSEEQLESVDDQFEEELEADEVDESDEGAIEEKIVSEIEEAKEIVDDEDENSSDRDEALKLVEQADEDSLVVEDEMAEESTVENPSLVSSGQELTLKSVNFTNDGKIAFTFTSGASIAVDPSIIARGSKRIIEISDVKLTVSFVDDQYIVELDGVRLVLPAVKKAA